MSGSSLKVAAVAAAAAAPPLGLCCRLLCALKIYLRNYFVFLDFVALFLFRWVVSSGERREALLG
jgi:hypothetical protein